MKRYFLSRDSYLCENSGHVVFLDLRRDRYLAIPPRAAVQMAKILPELREASWFACADSNAAEQSDESLLELARTLQDEGMLVEEEWRGKRPEPPAVTSANVAYWGCEGPLPRLHWTHLMSFFAAWISTSTVFRIRTLRAIVQNVHARNSKLRKSGQLIDRQEVRRLISIYSLLRTVTSYREGVCLRNSFMLIEFLSYHGVFPKWVFGVKMEPFAAHCWVQFEDIVLNDSSERTKAFTPLMVV